MKRSGRVGKLGALGAALMLGLCGGCVPDHRAPAPPELPVDIQAARQLPQPCKNRVHVLFIGGPFGTDLGGLAHLRDEIAAVGFIKGYSGHAAQKWGFLRAVRHSHDREPDARFALVAHAGGAALAPELVRQMQAEGMIIDLLLYLDPLGKPTPQPVRTVNLFTKGEAMAEAENLKLDAGPLTITKHEATRIVLLRELVAIAGRISLTSTSGHVPLTKRGEWDFLKPDGPPVGEPCFFPIHEVMESLPATFTSP